jgi:hypothetical protein
MKPRVALFGLPKVSAGKFSIFVYAEPFDNCYGHEIFKAVNDESGKLLEFIFSDINIGCEVTIVITSSGIVHYSHKLKYKGADISHVPIFKKELNIDEEYVSKDWNIDLWRKWNVRKQHDEGLAAEKKALLNRIISVSPLWESYYSDSNIDYFEKFQKLWIGLNSFAGQFSNETQDKNKILALVKSDLREEFNKKISTFSNQDSENKWKELQNLTGLNLTSEIVRDELNVNFYSLDFLELAKSATGIFSELSKELDGLIFLDKNEGKDVFRDIFSRYHKYMTSEEGILQNFNLSDAFIHPISPQSVQRLGRLVYHNPYLSSDSDSLFTLKDYFGTNYSNNSYSGQTLQKVKEWEIIDPLFFKYLYVLYKFRCAYFHGDLPLSKQNNELAKAAYQSLYEIFPAIL